MIKKRFLLVLLLLTSSYTQLSSGVAIFKRKAKPLVQFAGSAALVALGAYIDSRHGYHECTEGRSLEFGPGASIASWSSDEGLSIYWANIAALCCVWGGLIGIMSATDALQQPDTPPAGDVAIP